MDEYSNPVITPSDEIDPIMPDGWEDGMDLFGESEADPFEVEANETPAEPAQEATETPDGDEAPTTEPQDQTEADGEDATPTTESDPDASETHANRLKFRARIDHEDRDIEVDEADLPNLYQRAQATDRAQKRMAEMQATMDLATRLAKQMGFDSPDELLRSADENYRKAEVERLVNDGVHEEVAEMLVSQRMQLSELGNAAAPAPTAASETVALPTDTAGGDTAGGGRDYQREIAQLLAERPELQGKQLPEAVVKAAVNGKSLLHSYLEYEAQQSKAELAKLRKENSVYKQNAAAAARSPVTGVSGGGETDTKPSDPFLQGFNSEFT